MSRRPRYREQDFPPAGTVFAAPTGDGRFAAGRVLRRGIHLGAQGVLIAASPWLGNELPSLKSSAIRETLFLNHHSWRNVAEVFWVHDPMPDFFVVVGELELSSKDKKASSDTLAGWQSVPIQALLQWRWDHDREALLQEEARHAAERAEFQRQRAAARAEFMRTLTLDSLAERTWFQSWEDAEPALPLNECRSLIATLVNELRAAPKLTLSVVKKHLKQSVMDFNRLDEEHHFIFTTEREDLCEVFEQIACAAKFPQVIDQIERWRDW